MLAGYACQHCQSIYNDLPEFGMTWFSTLPEPVLSVVAGAIPAFRGATA
jgi:hypothetical protein